MVAKPISPVEPPTLRRSLSLPLTVFYGLGTILGAGIYSLIGEVAGSAGMYAPLAFVIAAVIAAFTGLSYAELSSRYPRSAGEAVYVQQGLGWPPLSTTVGLLIVFAGVVSSATLANAFVGYVQKLAILLSSPQFVADAWYLGRVPIMVTAILLLGGLALWGIRESVTVASIMTVIELGGLVLIIFVNGGALADLETRWRELVPPPDLDVWHGIFIAAFVAFYAFIGFEDMVNVAEEVKDAPRNLPRAIIIAIVVSALLYFLVALSAVLAHPPEELVKSAAPMAVLYEQGTGRDPWLITLISLFAVINGALIQMIMASRILYGISRRGWLPAALSYVHPGRRTPMVATALTSVLILAAALPLGLRALADTTSFIILIVYIFINLSLIRIKRRDPVALGARIFPAWVPWLGLFTSLVFVVSKLLSLWR